MAWAVVVALWLLLWWLSWLLLCWRLLRWFPGL